MPSKANVAYTAKWIAAKKDPTLVEFGKLAVRLARLSPAPLPLEVALQMASAMRCPAIVIDGTGKQHHTEPQPQLESGVDDLAAMMEWDGPDASVDIATSDANAVAQNLDAAAAACAAPSAYGRAPIGKDYSAPAVSTVAAAGRGRRAISSASARLNTLHLKLVASSTLLPPPEGTSLEDREDVLFITAVFANATDASSKLQIIAFFCKGMEAADGPPFSDRVRNMARRMSYTPLNAVRCVISDSDARHIVAMRCAGIAAPKLKPNNRRVFLLGAKGNV